MKLRKPGNNAPGLYDRVSYSTRTGEMAEMSAERTRLALCGKSRLISLALLSECLNPSNRFQRWRRHVFCSHIHRVPRRLISDSNEPSWGNTPESREDSERRTSLVGLFSPRRWRRRRKTKKKKIDFRSRLSPWATRVGLPDSSDCVLICAFNSSSSYTARPNILASQLNAKRLFLCFHFAREVLQ